MTTSNNTPRLQYTTDLDRFDMHEHNRPLTPKPALLASMRKYGYLPSCPLHCVSNGSKKLRIIRGHHRIDYARRLGIGVWYVIDNSCTDIFALEGGGRQDWSLGDFAKARALAGEESALFLTHFAEEHCLNMTSALSLLSGESAGSGNRSEQFKRGDWRVVNLGFAEAVVAITDELRELGLSFATTRAFVAAVSATIQVPEFDPGRLLHRARLYPANLHRRTSVGEYLEEIEALYNYAVRGDQRIPLAFRASGLSRQRNPTHSRGEL